MSSDGTGGGPTKDGNLMLRLAGGADAASTARRALSQIREKVDPPTMETMRLLVTELVSNSVRHAGADSVDLKVEVGHKAVWIEVTDEGAGFEPRPSPGRVDGDGGWGLFLVETLADKWGVVREDGGTRVWLELQHG